MNGIHDLGGMHGFGPIEIEPDEPPFHARWEGRVVGIMIQAMFRGYYNIDGFRHGIETMEPEHYLRATYFERWRTSVEKNLIRAGATTREELDGRVRALDDGSAPAKAGPAATAATSGGPQPGFVRHVEAAPRFAPGHGVRARNLHPPGHTRLPRYVRQKRGTICTVYPAFVFPDTNAHGRGESPQYLYNVEFLGAALWGTAAEPGSLVRIDLFESYLEPA